jgi:hypothetical protein
MQRYRWQQADGRRHVYDTDTDEVREGCSFTALCGETVTPRAGRGDLTAGLWFDGECPVCTVVLATLLGWARREVAELARRFDWRPELTTRLANVLRCSSGEVAALTGDGKVGA